LLAIALPDWKALRDEMTRIVSGFHSKYPLRRGIPREELKSQLDLSLRVFGASLARAVSDGILSETGHSIARRGHTIQFDVHDLAKVNALMQEFERNPFGPPGSKLCKSATGEEVFGALLALGELVAVSDDVVFRKADYDFMVTKVRSTLAEKGEVTLAQARDLFQTSRKYAQALLEHLDTIGVTRRSGDSRVPAT
jgi:selenocysteine-specific elongation factor